MFEIFRRGNRTFVELQSQMRNIMRGMGRHSPRDGSSLIWTNADGAIDPHLVDPPGAAGLEGDPFA